MTWLVSVLNRCSLPEIRRSLLLADLVPVFWRIPRSRPYRRTLSGVSLEKVAPSLVVAIVTTPRSIPRDSVGSAGSTSGVSTVG